MEFGRVEPPVKVFGHLRKEMELVIQLELPTTFTDGRDSPRSRWKWLSPGSLAGCEIVENDSNESGRDVV